jgi:hypothetical protein
MLATDSAGDETKAQGFPSSAAVTISSLVIAVASIIL